MQQQSFGFAPPTATPTATPTRPTPAARSSAAGTRERDVVAPVKQVPAIAGASAPAASAGSATSALTPQMHAIVAANDARLVVRAGAGTGKTTTAAAYAAARPRESMLYLAFNRSVREDASKRMPASVEARTTHSVAWRAIVPRLFGGRGRAPGDFTGETRPMAAAQFLGCQTPHAHVALKTLHAWFCSADDEPGPEHVPPEAGTLPGIARGQHTERVLALAADLWAGMQSGKHPDVKLTPDGYLKLFALGRPTLRGYKRVIVDEAQDLNRCTFAMLAAQNVPLLFIGDSAQQIYGFRGTVDALGELGGSRRLDLSRSFRFGPGIAKLANVLLDEFRPGVGVSLEGLGAPTRFEVDRRAGYATLCRSNSGLFDHAVDALRMRGRRFHFVGGIAGYRLDDLVDAANLLLGRHWLVRSAHLRAFASFDELAAYAERDTESRQLVRAAHFYGDRIFSLVEQIKQRSVDTLPAGQRACDFPGLVFSTVHRAKGLEFDQCVLGDDFMPFFDSKGRPLTALSVDAEDVNILYVALTRARHAIEIAPTYGEWLAHRRINWQRPA